MTLTVRVAGILKRCFAVLHPCVYGLSDAETAGGTAAIEAALTPRTKVLLRIPVLCGIIVAWIIREIRTRRKRNGLRIALMSFVEMRIASKVFCL